MEPIETVSVSAEINMPEPFNIDFALHKNSIINDHNYDIGSFDKVWTESIEIKDDPPIQNRLSDMQKNSVFSVKNSTFNCNRIISEVASSEENSMLLKKYQCTMCKNAETSVIASILHLSEEHKIHSNNSEVIIPSFDSEELIVDNATSSYIDISEEIRLFRTFKYINNTFETRKILPIIHHVSTVKNSIRIYFILTIG